MSHSPRRFRSDLNYLIYKHLTAAGIEIPNPQRDLHIRSGTLKVETRSIEASIRITGRVMLSEAKHLGLWQWQLDPEVTRDSSLRSE